MRKIVDKLYAFVGGSIDNIVYYIDDDIKIQIDASFILDKKVDVLILTHHHWDHIFALQEIVKKNKCKVWASKHIKEFFPEGKIDRALKDGDEIKTKNFSFKVLETPGHAADEICLWDPKKKILFSGDVWFRDDVYGRTDLPASDPLDMRKSVDRLHALKPKHLLPGHPY